MLKKILKILGLLLLIIVVGSAAYLFWASNGAPASQSALDALQSDASVTVSEDPWISFTPVAAQPGTGIIFYPGGQADPRSYAPPMRALAEQGFLAVIVPMPFNLAVFDIGAASEVLAAHPEIDRWMIAGHSLGGVMAAQYAFDNPAAIDALALWAAYPAGSADFSSSVMPIGVIYGSADQMATVEEVEATAGLLPAEARWTLIEGADHYQFGYFDEVPVNASINREQQQQAIIEAMQVLLADIPETQ